MLPPLYLQGRAPVAFGHVTWTSETVWTLHGREKSVCMAGVETFPSVTILIELSLLWLIKRDELVIFFLNSFHTVVF
jgi:hypothetical protein